MTEQIHQIEYRWHSSWDLSPAASSMRRELTMRRDAQIRNWVRHPSVEAPSESVRYQILPGGVAALAWRYQNLEVTDADGGVRGRPLVSRVLVGAEKALSPEVGMILCRSGLPVMAGPRPGEVEPESGLPVISAADLAAFAHDTIDGLDHEAAWEEDLRPVLAAAFADPDTPLAVGIGEPQIFQPSAQGIQVLLLWGLWRIGHPLLGARQRGWSFSTFEPPLGYVDPKTLPDILFRSARVTQTAPPAMPRNELKVFPGEVSASETGAVYDELAAWLVAEYREMGGDELQRRIAELVGGTPSDSRLLIAYDRLSARWAPPAPDSGEPEVPAPETLAPDALVPETSEPKATGQEPSGVIDLPGQGKPEYDEIARPAFAVADLLDQLAIAGDTDLFESLLAEVIAVPLQPDGADRQRARAILGDNNCLIPVFRRHRYDPHEYELSRIVCLTVIPDLDQLGVREEIAAWAYRGERAVVAALLAAARDSGTEAWRVMRETLEPVLADLWLIDRGLLTAWSPGPASPPDVTPWRGLHIPGRPP
ncbi:MAG: hypothetical protein ACLPQY_10355 [Streptosporangiaceae bacterium]